MQFDPPRRAAESANLAPWFGPNLQRNVYMSLLHAEPAEGSQGPAVPESVLKAALVRRAVEDIQRLIQIKTAKQACSSLLQRGSVGDDLWQRFQRAEREMEDELRDVVTEANALAPNWGHAIFQSAHEIASNTKLRESLAEIETQAASEKAWWEKRRGQIQSAFIRELDQESTIAADAKQQPKAAAAKAGSSTVASEDEAVLVDAPAAKSGGN
ncbi:translocation protein (Sec66) [Cordyceps fumosorosea ARSEF 2679]|uniref:Translocation protein (Sec66) n=1 Tax=Cordyceps fumosorosea (strain ARSEF 2679) TaxID=1081104 RepID=A0A162MPC2_CORFA|nr:translocation protein (Sec66) [Cordyceps fumosorosea ARSEF 2679]OAA64850.1 translocation protein (Sec66) [Cordyceps fumosorosea ARSEF 2679]